MSIGSEIERIRNNVSDALTATSEMGVDVPATASSDDLGNLIRAIPKGGTYYGVCTTDAATAEKTVNIDGFKLVEGAMVIVKFDNANSASNPTLNVSGTGAKPMYRYGTTVISTGTTTTGWIADAVQIFIYDGTGWIRDYWNNTTYSNASLGNGYATCSTAASTKAKTASLSSYALSTGGCVSVKFTNAVPAGATLNIASKGAKAIYYKGAAITDGVIKAGDTATFVYSTYYHLIAIDRDTYTKDEVDTAITNSKYTLPTASSSTLGGVKVGSNLTISSGVLSVPTASGTQAGATIVYPAASCTTFTSDSGTCTPAAVKKAVGMFEPKAHTHSWESVSDKPFTVVNSDTLTWNGDKTGREVSDYGDGINYDVHVSDVIPTEADFGNGATVRLSDGAQISVTCRKYIDTLMLRNGNNAYAFVALVDNANGMGYLYPKAGVYFYYEEGGTYTASLTINGYTGFACEKLNASCLPDVSSLSPAWIADLKAALGIS